MAMTRETMTASDGKNISIAVWPCENPIGLVQIAHGMCEHIERYDRFASALNDNGFIVFGDDHRGHGQTDPDALGLARGDIFRDTARDMRELSELFIGRYRLPLVLFGHSYGSFLSQYYLLKGRETLAGLVLSGSALMQGASVNLGHLIAKRRLKRKKDEPGDIMASLTFKAYDRKFKEGKNGWLTRDKAEVGKYNVDPHCGYTCSYGFYYYFFDGLKEVARAKATYGAPDFRLLITSGACDLVGGKKAKLVRKLDRRYREVGFNPALKLYDNARHEILNEINRDEVTADIVQFIRQCVDA